MAKTTIWGQTHAVRANFAEASSPIYSLTCDGDWTSTGRQVADYAHRPMAALRADIEASCQWVAEGHVGNMIVLLRLAI